MKFYTTLLTVLFFHFGFSQTWLELMQSSDNVFDAKKEFDQYWKDKPIEKGTGYKQFLRWHNFWAPRTFPSGEISKVDPSKGLNQHFNLLEEKSMLKSSDSPWTSMGPNTTNSGYNGIGRINVIEFHPLEPDTWFVGTPGGGLWKTTDAGVSWTPLTDFLTNLGISDIAISSNNPDIIYIATGDRDARDTYSFGVLKSTDGGNTWNDTGLTSTVQNTWTTNRILLNPSNENIVLVATGNGIYRSTDAGANFSHVQPNGHFITMEFNPADPNIVYAGQFDYWSEQARFFKSTDNGLTWSPITTGLPASNCRRMHIGVSPDNADYVYLITVNNENGMEGLYRSTNSGVSFSLMTSTPNLLHSGDGTGTGGQGWYDLSLAISPTNIDEIYVGGINMWKSTNGGVNFNKMTHWFNDGSTVIHADQHWFTYHNGDLYVCNDGGLYVTSDGANSFSDLSNGLAITQYYRLSNDQNTDNKLIAGAQDNGTDLLVGGNRFDVNGGDGMHCIIDYSDPNVVFSSTQNGSIYRSTDGGYNYSNVSPDPGNGAWITPYEMDPSNHDIMYCGYSDIYKSIDNGVSWTQSTFGLSTELLQHIEVSKSDGNILYCASYSELFKSTDGGNSFTNVTGTLPVGNASISSICIDPSDENHVWVTFSGYSSGEKVFVTEDGTNSWTNLSGALPNLPVNTLIYQEGSNGSLFVGTDVGVYWWDPATTAWDIYGTDLPNVIVNDLSIQYSQGLMRAATYGRGVWEIPLEIINVPTPNFNASETSVCEGSLVNFINTSFQADTYLWSFTGGEPSTSTDSDPVVTYNNPGTYDVKLIAYNQNGSDTLEYTNYIQVQANEINTASLGNSSNIYTNIRNNTQPIVVNNDLNTVTFIHRQNTSEYSGTSGMLRYDYSLDNGQNWSLDNGVLNPSATVGVNDARYPQINIYNPSGNTDPTNAKIIYNSPTVGADWNGYVSGDGNIGSESFTENYNQGTPTNTLIPGGFSKGEQGVFWSIDAIFDGTDYSGLQLLKGQWNGTNLIWNVEESLTPDFNTDIEGSPSLSAASYDIAFDPSGQNGWIVFLSHLNGAINNYQFYPIFYQTTDGGNTWTGPIEVDLSAFTSISSNLTGTGVASAAYDIDLAVDANGNPHALLNVCSGSNSNYSINTTEWMGACHLHYDGTSWDANILGQIQTLRYTLTDGAYMDNTPQISRSDDGSIMAFSWTDSDPLITGGNNSQPFLNLVSYNTNSDYYSPLETPDICSLNPGSIAFLHCADALLETQEGYEVASVISEINSSGSGLDQTGHIYFSLPIPNACSSAPSITPLGSIEVCETYTLPTITGTNLTGQESYYSISGGPDAVGQTSISPGTEISSPGSIYIYDGNMGCSDEKIIEIEIKSNTGTDTQLKCGSYTWIDGNIYTESNNSATYNLTNAAGCDSLVTLNLTIQPPIDNSVNNFGDQLSANLSNANYQWLDCNQNYQIISGETNQHFTANENGNYAVEITKNECVDTSACYPITTVGIIENNFGSTLKIYPNPTSGKFSIDLQSVHESIEISIHDIHGKLVQSKLFEKGQVFNMSILESSGLYHVTIKSGDQKAVVRLIKN